MKLSNTFVEGKMNKDVDERLLPKGIYPHAENIRVSNTDSSDMGAIENVKGAEKLTDFNLTNAKTIGGFSDSSNQKLYWFTTSDEKDLVIEYDVLNNVLEVLLESSKPNGVLNFNKRFLITGVSKIINGDSKRDLLVWTDDLNPPRIINIERAKTFAADGFIEDDISLIKKPPRYAPKIELTYTSTTLENNIENKFLSFAYRYKYPDGEVSALSSFTNYSFAPKSFDLDFQTMENEGMVNAFNAVKIKFDTGSERVKDVELVFKESNSETVYLIQSFNKLKEGWLDNQERDFLFSNSKILSPLPIEEIARTYDNVPRKAKALEVIGNRVVFGNYVEQYDLKNIFGEDIKIDYNISSVFKSLNGEVLSSVFSTQNVINDVFTFNIGLNSLVKGSRITFDFNLGEATYDDGSYEGSLDFILNEDFTSCSDLASSPDFISFIEDVCTNDFLANYSATPPDDSEVLSYTGFTVQGSTGATISILTPRLVYTIDDTPSDLTDNPLNTHEEISYWSCNSETAAFYKEIAVDTSLKTNRSYEVGLVYLDEYNRASTVLTDPRNSIYIPQDYSTYQNKLVVNVNHQPPYWADRYKFVIKQNKGEYQTIYTNVFYEDGLFRWVKLEGANVDKVRTGDTLIVKSDLGGALERVVKVKVLEISSKEKDFIEGNENLDGDPIIEESGLYMKIKPVGFDMDFSRSSARTFERSNHLRRPVRTPTLPEFGSYTGATFVPLKLNAGSRVRIFIKFEQRGKASYIGTYDKDFIVSNDYDSVKDWFEAEVQDLGSFGDEYTREWGFTPSGEQFYVRAHKDGTASRKITTTLKFEILFSEGIVIFETEPEDSNVEVFYETGETFDIVDGKHLGNIQDQSNADFTAISELDFFNCYVQGNGAESYRYKDAFNVGTNSTGQKIAANYLNIDLRPTSTSVEEYKEVRRYADLTYSSPYNENTNINGLNEFNLARINFKEDIDKKYGFIQKLFTRDTNLVVFQEDKVSYVLFGKDLLMNADGTSNVTSSEEVLGELVAYSGEYGISRNPESFTFDSNNLYFADSKRGCVLRLGAQGLTEISMSGLRTFFKDKFKDSLNKKTLGSFDPYYDQYVLHTSEDTLDRPETINCGSSYIKTSIPNFTELSLNFGIFLGDVGFDYTSNGKPVRYTISWNGNIYSSGFVGESSYDQDLIDLGYPATSGSSVGSLVFDKTESIPSEATLTIEAPLCDTNISLNVNCANREEITVINAIVNGGEFVDKTVTNRYKWFNNTYSSPYKNYNTVFNGDLVNTFEIIGGLEGDVGIPLNNSTVVVESFKSFNDTTVIKNCSKVSYLVSDTLYTESQIESIISSSTVLNLTELTNTSGEITKRGVFNLVRPSNEKYLYIIWDYRDRQPKAFDDYYSVQNGQSKFLPVKSNDLDPFGLVLGLPVIQNQPVNGTAVVQPDGTIEYTHNGSETFSDVFTYTVSNGVCESNTASVFIDIAISCTDAFQYSGYQGVIEEVVSFGTAIGDCGIAYNAFNAPDKFEIIWDGNIVATTGGLVSNSGSLIFNKSTPLPTTAIVRVTAPLEGTAWEFSGICPLSAGTSFDNNVESFDSENITFDEQ